MRRVVGVIALASSLFTVAACERGAAPLKSEDLGGSAWQSTDVGCKADSDCNTGETCTNNVCQMKRCGDPNYKSVSPLGAIGFFAHERELVVAGDATEVAGYDLSNRTFVHPDNTNWSSGGNTLDVAGGNLLGSRPEIIATIDDSSQNAIVHAPDGDKTVALPFVATALAAGDVDADSIDELVAFSGTGQVAVCKATDGTCITLPGAPDGQSGSMTVVDGAVGDVDGDGFAEPVLLTSTSFIVFNADAPKTGNTKAIEYKAPKQFGRIAAGDLDADGIDEIVAIYDTFFTHDLHVFSLKGGQLVEKSKTSTDKGFVDVAVGLFGGEQPEVALLRDDSSVEMFSPNSTLGLTSEFRSALSSTRQATRITAADFNGDSPTRTLIGKPTLVPGPVVPMAVMTLPPYSRTHSEGQSSVTMGQEQSSSVTKSDGTMMYLQAGIGFDAELDVVVVKALEVEAEAHYLQQDYHTEGSSTTLGISASFEVEAKPEMEGYDSGAVVLGCGCYHRYDYKLNDPAHKLGAKVDGTTMSILVPVGGQSSVWSTRRYNALVDALGGKTLPKIQIPYQLGQVASYPKGPLTLTGAPIDQSDMVFTDPPTFRVSETASTEFELSVEKEHTNEDWVYKGAGVSASLAALGVVASGSYDKLMGKGYAIAVSQRSAFGGTVPPMRNDPTTPEDELKLYGYSFTPLLYRQAFDLGDDGGQGSYFVLTYAVGK
jgi:hypothetical protein